MTPKENVQEEEGDDEEEVKIVGTNPVPSSASANMPVKNEPGSSKEPKSSSVIDRCVTAYEQKSKRYQLPLRLLL